MYTAGAVYEICKFNFHLQFDTLETTQDGNFSSTAVRTRGFNEGTFSVGHLQIKERIF